MIQPLLILLVATASAPPRSAGDEVQFQRDVRPLLADRCFACHGPDEDARKAGLRLDVREAAVAQVITPGSAEESELLARISSTDADVRMPPPESGAALSAEEQQLLRLWVASGADYEEHWAFVAPQRPALPGIDMPHPIDAFVAAQLVREALTPAPEASRETLVRRVAFDLTGLPPSLDEVDAFLDDSAPGAYERMLERALDSPHYGEHMARRWLDLARYADTDGYQYDKERNQWAWRDWVVRAYQQNLPYDDFTLQQLAGDLLPDASAEQITATGFHRNHPITIEGGVIDEEYRTEYVMDRVKTTGLAWMGLTTECARCHDHKFDPLSQREFYQLFAFFNQVPERGNQGFDPRLDVVTSAALAELARLDARIAEVEARDWTDPDELRAWEQRLRGAAGWRASPEARITALRIPTPANAVHLTVTHADEVVLLGRYVRVELVETTNYLSLAEVEVLSRGENVARAGTAPQSSLTAGGVAVRAIDGNTSGVHSDGTVSHTNQQAGAWWEVDLGAELPLEAIALYNRTDCCADRWDGFQLSVLNEERHMVWSARDSGERRLQRFQLGGPVTTALEARQGAWVLPEPLELGVGTELVVEADGLTPDANSIEYSEDARWLEWGGLADELARAASSSEPTDEQRDALERHIFESSPAHEAARSERDAFAAERARVAEQGRTSVLVMRDQPRMRATHVLERGQYDQPRAAVSADTPAFLPSMGELARDRLGLARWLTAPEHPLTARVAVNRLWEQCFGVGLVTTLENFGTQGSFPTHPELLDWLAVELVESGWDVRAMLRLIMSSATYRQSSNARPIDFDPALYASGPRFRLEAEAIRDQALAVSGLLDRRVGGRGTFPYQPAGLWQELNNRPGFSTTYPEPTLDQVHRRSLYTFWKRTLPPPSMQLFDAPNREVCTLSRSRTNTPLQALALLHDVQYVEAARALAERMLREVGEQDAARLEHGFRLCTSRHPDALERDELLAFLAEERERFLGDPEAARAALAVGISPRDESLPAAEHAAWTSVARVLLNLSEVITRG